MDIDTDTNCPSCGAHHTEKCGPDCAFDPSPRRCEDSHTFRDSMGYWVSSRCVRRATVRIHFWVPMAWGGYMETFNACSTCAPSVRVVMDPCPG